MHNPVYKNNEKIFIQTDNLKYRKIMQTGGIEPGYRKPLDRW